MSHEDALEREEQILHDEYDRGDITRAQLNSALRDLPRQYQGEAQETAPSAYALDKPHDICAAAPKAVTPTPGITLTLNPRQVQALKTGLEQLRTLFTFTGLDEKDNYDPFYKIAGLYQEVLDMLPSATGKEVKP